LRFLALGRGLLLRFGSASFGRLTLLFGLGGLGLTLRFLALSGGLLLRFGPAKL
jgi:hypothetical protein